MDEDCGKVNRSKRIIAVAVCLIFILSAAVCIIFREPVIRFAAIGQIHSGQYERAVKIAGLAPSPEGNAVKDYAALRLEIRNGYSALTAGYDRGVICLWRDTAVTLDDSGYLTDAEIVSELHELRVKLTYLASAEAGYSAVADSISDLFLVFSEYNRLHSKGAGNPSFVPVEELDRIDLWQKELDEVMRYAVSLPKHESIYLFSYFLKEARSETEQLRTEMQNVIKNGYSLTDTVRYPGTGMRNFPTVTNTDGTGVRLADAESYGNAMKDAVLRHLVQTQLVKFYNIPE